MGAERPKVGDPVIDEQGAGCGGDPAQSEDAELKAELPFHTDFPARCLNQHGDADLERLLMTTVPSHCKEQSNPQAPLSSATSPR